jgi:hypothetical protein
MDPPKKANASSPPFSHQEISNNFRHWTIFPLDKNANCKGIEKSISVPQMEAVSYSSNGKFFNATIWLSSQFNEVPSEDHRPMYSMGIGVIPASDTKLKVDYVLTIWWNQLRQYWIRTLEEVSTDSTRVLEEDLNFTDFFDKAQSLRKIEDRGHVNLSLDLDKITSPDQYFALFLVADVNKTKDPEGFTQFCGLTDFSDTAVPIPPARFNLSPSSNLIEMRQGDERRIELRINSTSIVNPLISLNSSKPKGIEEVKIEPDKLYLPPAGMVTSILDIKAMNNAEVQPYTIPIYANISFPKIDVGPYTLPIFSERELTPKINLAQISAVNGASNNLSSSIIPRPAYISVNMEKSPTPEEQFKSLWDIYGDPLSLVIGGFVAGFAALVMDKLRKRSKIKYEY